MTGSAALALGTDVFIVFSKKVTGEAKLARAIKADLSSLGSCRWSTRTGLG